MKFGESVTKIPSKHPRYKYKSPRLVELFKHYWDKKFTFVIEKSLLHKGEVIMYKLPR